MRILIIVGSFKTGGAERISINTGEELIRRGYDVYYIVQRPVFEIPNSIPPDKIIVLRKEPRSDLLYKINSLFLGVFKASSSIKPDVVIAFSRFSSFLACFTFNRNIIARFDANPFRLSKKQRVWADIVLNNPFVKKVVVPSSGMLNALKNTRPQKADKLYVIPNSINPDYILDKEDKSAKFNFRYIAAMGRLSSDKNFELLIQAFHKSDIKERYKLVIIGEGKLRQVLEHSVKSLGLKDKVIFTGRLQNPFPILSSADFFVNTSLNESFCNVILEALTLGKPVIATDCDYGPSDMIESGLNGFLIPNNNLEQLVAKLNELGHNEMLVNSLGMKANESANKFYLEQVGNIWEKLITNNEN